MSSIITLEGLSTPGPPETRALAYINVEYRSNVYAWQVYLPSNIPSINEYLSTIQSSIESEIDAKETEWEALDPKTRIVERPFGRSITVDIQKEEIVKPDIPDYYAKRRMEYPSEFEQLDAIWKGQGSSNYVSVENAISQVKTKYPKVYRTPEEFQNDLMETIIQSTQKRLDNFARTRNYDGILSACTYENSPIQKFQEEGQYCVQARAFTWAKLYEILTEVQTGIRPVPSSFSDIEPELPTLIWPN